MSMLHTVTQSNLFLIMSQHVCLDGYFVICFYFQNAFEVDESVVHTGGDEQINFLFKKYDNQQLKLVIN